MTAELSQRDDPTAESPQGPVRARAHAALIGSGIMSAHLGALLKSLAPDMTVQVFETNSQLAHESSDGWNNAGTGHAGICEISYTPTRGADGKVDVRLAREIFEQFLLSKQFWSYAAAAGLVGDPRDFVHRTPHIGFVRGAADVDFLEARHAAMVEHHFFRTMEISREASRIAEWSPLLTEGRQPEPIAATRMEAGTEVHFGHLARQLLQWLGRQEGCRIAVGQRVTRLRRDGNAWEVTATCRNTGERQRCLADFVFVGAGGGTLPVLQSTGLPETHGLASFPIGGQWLVCDVEEACVRHAAKVYGAALPAAPSLGAPHLDARTLDGRRYLLFGPYASWTTRFLKGSGHWTDLPRSIRPGNWTALVRAAWKNRQLVGYLIQQGLQNSEHRMRPLRDFYPAARAEDWRLVEAGIRVQTIKKSDRGAVYFGTEVFTAAGGTIAALLGASPGASVSASIALGVVRRCFPQLLARSAARDRLLRMLPAYGEDLQQPHNAGLFASIEARADEILRLSSPAS